MTSGQKALQVVCNKACNEVYKPITARTAALAEDLLCEEAVSYRQICLVGYQVSDLLEVLKPELKEDITLLTEMNEAIAAWAREIEYVNRILGLQPEA